MAMDLRDPNVWISHLLENLPEEKQASALKDDNPDWGVYRRRNRQTGFTGPQPTGYPGTPAPGLVILASESKDFRLLAHLLRTLQHAGDPLLALRLLALYVEHYWAVAAPQNMAHKNASPARSLNALKQVLKAFHRTPPQRSAMRY